MSLGMRDDRNFKKGAGMSLGSLPRNILSLRSMGVFCTSCSLGHT